MGKTVFSAVEAAQLEFSVNPFFPGALELSAGVVLGVTEGGAQYSYGKGSPCVVHTLRFNDMPAADYDGGFDYASGVQEDGTQSLVNWFMFVCPPGSGLFSYLDAFGGSHEVEFAETGLEFSLTGAGLYSGTVRLREYVGSL